MDKAVLLKKIEGQVKNCKKCRLCETALNAVPGEGNIDSKIIFIGEAPGATEDQTGRPFVGRAGRLLDQLLGEIGMKRSDVWIGNIIKHRPPENRDPLPEEIKACVPYLAQQIKLINPTLVITLGRFGMNFFYPEGKISYDHGRLIKLKNLSIYPLYHPAAGLRNGNMLAALREDFLKIPKVIEEMEKNANTSKNESNEVEYPLSALGI